MHVVLIFLILSSIEHFSIHQQEYFSHLSEASFTPLTEKRLEAEPLIEPGEKGLKHTYYGYFPYWVDTTYFSTIDFSLLTHVAYFSIGINTDGTLGSVPNESRLLALINYAHKRGVRVHITFTLFGNTNVSTFLNNGTARLTAINRILQVVENYGIEGANIDFEFVTSTVKDSFSQFINDLYYALQNQTSRRKDLYIAMPAVPEWYPGYDYTYLANHSDGLFIMAYDFHYSGSSNAGPVSPAIPSSIWGSYCVARTIRTYKSYCSPDKIIVGLPYYGYRWPTQSGNINSPTTGSGTSVLMRVAVQEAPTYGRLWDSNSLTPWYRYQSSGQWYQVWYDDTASIRIKVQMAKDSSVKGVGCWALGYDNGLTNNVIRQVLDIPLPNNHFVIKVLAAQLNIREGPSTNYPVITTADSASKFVAFYREGYWHKVYFPSASGGYYGWMYAGDGINVRYMEGSANDSIVFCTANLLNVREGPGTSYPVITQITYGQAFVLDSVIGNWGRIYLPNISSYKKGWISLSYTTIYWNIEGSNTLTGQLLEVIYPDETFMPGDTFTLRLKIQNTSNSTFNQNVLLTSTDLNSPFYYPEYWLDSRRAIPQGHFGLPGQTFYLDFKLMVSPEKETLEEIFYLVRDNEIILGPINISVFLPVKEQQETIQITFLGNRLIFNGFTRIATENLTLKLFDISGRLVFSEKITGNFDKPIDIPMGVYFAVVTMKNHEILRRKIMKLQ